MPDAMEAYSTSEEKPFSHSMEKFEALIAELGEQRLVDAQHEDVELLIEEQGREVLRQLFQDHLTLRAPATPVDGQVAGSDGKLRKNRRAMRRSLTSIFGTVEVGRIGYRGHDVGALTPLDAVLNLPPDKYSHGVRRKVAALAGKNSFEDVSATMSKSTGAPIPKRQVEQMAQAVAVDFDAYYEQRSAELVEETASLLVLSFDGTGIHMRPEALREATRKKREQMQGQDRWPAPVRTGPQRNNGTRSATVSVCYEVQPYPRTFQDVLRDLRPVNPVVAADNGRRPRPKPQAKRVSASLDKSVQQVVQERFEQALHRDPAKLKEWVVLLDGNEHQLEAVQAQAALMGLDVTIIIDMIHVAGYVWAAAKALYPEDFAKRRAWVMDKLAHILWGDASTMAGAMRRSATMRKLDAKEREPIDRCANYLLKYQRYLRYDDALARGLPITTGVVEGACRHLVKDRMAITGARWGLEGGESVLRLRALILNGDLDDYLDFHKARELERNHLSHYDKARVPDLELPDQRKPLLRLVK
jgi:hypothetical protein